MGASHPRNDYARVAKYVQTELHVVESCPLTQSIRDLHEFNSWEQLLAKDTDIAIEIVHSILSTYKWSPVLNELDNVLTVFIILSMAKCRAWKINIHTISCVKLFI